MDNESPTYEQQKSYYDKKWLHVISRRKGEDAICLEEFVISSLKNLKSRFKHQLKIIDLGCGSGWITKSLSRYGDVIGVDLSTGAAEALYTDVKFLQANIVTDEIEGKYDIVVSSEVIEHLSHEDQQIYVRKAYDLLNEAGYLVLTTPNKPRVEDLVRELAISRQQLQPIENWLDQQSLARLLAPCFEITDTGSTVFHPIFIRKLRPLHLAYILVYTYLRLYKLVNRLLRTSQRGLYLTIVARKLQQS